MTERRWPRGPGIASRARQKVCLPSGGTECVTWFDPGTNGGCVIMTGGFAVVAVGDLDRALSLKGENHVCPR